jgi:glutamate-ammonia-ligase adenylyltransferase
VSSVSSFNRYQEKSAWLWEHQALTRARYCAGYAPIEAQFDATRMQVLTQKRDALKLKEEVLNMRKKMRDANLNRTDLFDLKHDVGGMIDIEFMVQYLVLLHSNHYPELTGNIGNIALLKRCGDLGLIDAAMALETANAYRVFRKLQHNIRLQGEEKARVAKDIIASEVLATSGLWASLFTPHSE